MNRYCYILMVLLGLIISPCFAMLDPRAFGQIQQQAPEQPIEPELSSVYGMEMVAAAEPSAPEEEQQVTALEQPKETRFDKTLQSLPTITERSQIFATITDLLNYQETAISSDSTDNNAIINSIKQALIRLASADQMDPVTINLLLEGENLIQQLLEISRRHALQGMTLLKQIVPLLATDADDREQQAKDLLQTIRELLTAQHAQPSAPITVQPAPIQQIATPISPAQQVQTGQPAPTTPSNPATQPPTRSTTSSKAHESITKANSKLSSALRRLDAIKGYYKEIGQEDRKVIKTKAENVLKEYQKGTSSFAHRIGQVKNELGARVDKDKLAPFNTFIDLVNKLSQGIKRL